MQAIFSRLLFFRFLPTKAKDQ